MATLATDTARDFELGDFNDLPVVADDIIFEGSAVGASSGYARPLVAGDAFLGFATQQADNAGGSAGDVNVRVRTTGKIKLAVGSLAITNVGASVYASDDATFTLTSTDNTLIGTVYRFVESGVGIIKFDV